MGVPPWAIDNLTDATSFELEGRQLRQQRHPPDLDEKWSKFSTVFRPMARQPDRNAADYQTAPLQDKQDPAPDRGRTDHDPATTAKIASKAKNFQERDHQNSLRAKEENA